MGGLIVPEAALARQGLAIGEQTLPGSGQLGLGGKAFEVRLAIAGTQKETPVGVEVLLELKLVACRIRL